MAALTDGEGVQGRADDADPAFTYRSPPWSTATHWPTSPLRGPGPDATETPLGTWSHQPRPTGAQLAERLCQQIRVWDRDRTAQPTITAYPAGTPDQDLTDGVVINKQFVRLVVSN